MDRSQPPSGQHIPPPNVARAEVRFWPKVNKTPACWLWTAGTDAAGYGRFKVDGVAAVAHRYAYELLCGPIPDGLQIDHLCRVRHCVNPAHMEPVTLVENVRRGDSFSAQNAAKTYCANGHPYDEANTYMRPDGGRGCRSCRREAKRVSHAREEASPAPRPAVT